MLFDFFAGVNEKNFAGGGTCICCCSCYRSSLPSAFLKCQIRLIDLFGMFGILKCQLATLVPVLYVSFSADDQRACGRADNGCHDRRQRGRLSTTSL